jgi:hypothetical protein
MEFAAAATLHDLLAFKLGNDPLHLEQQLILRGVRNGAIDKDDIHA